MRRALVATVAVLAAILLQVTVLNNLPFPGGSPPNLVLVVVVYVALTTGSVRRVDSLDRPADEESDKRS